MVDRRLRVIRTEKFNLISNLRGEVGEIVTTWILYKHLITERDKLRTDDLKADMSNRQLVFLNMLSTKMRDEIIARLSEISETKIGRLTFYFAAEKIKALQDDSEKFTNFIEINGFRKKRNWDISHKELPEKWSDQQAPIQIPYIKLVWAVAFALRLMKKIDRTVLGPSTPFLWREMRKRRYRLVYPAKVGYMLLPYLKLSKRERVRIIEEESREGLDVWSIMEAEVDGKMDKVKVCKKWGAVVLGKRLLMLREYPLQSLSRINTKDDTSIVEKSNASSLLDQQYPQNTD